MQIANLLKNNESLLVALCEYLDKEIKNELDILALPINRGMSNTEFRDKLIKHNMRCVILSEIKTGLIAETRK